MEIGSTPIYQEIPSGWKLLRGATTAPVGYELICNGESRFSPDYKIALVKGRPQESQKEAVEASLSTVMLKPMYKKERDTKINDVCFSDEPGISQKLNQLAREQMKLRLLKDIEADITVCKLEGWEYRDYLRELQGEIQRFLDGR